MLLLAALALPRLALAVPPSGQAGGARADTTPPARERVAPPEMALARRWMSLDATGVDRFLKLHPTADGRGVLIAILDSGIDAGIPGLGLTSEGTPKLLDLRDFSHEGAVALAPLTVSGDTAVVAGVRLSGLSRVAARSSGPYFAGALDELPLGTPPASDVNGNGSTRDVLPVVVARAPEGWVLYTDTDGDGSLANERPIHDYLQGRETFGWSVHGRPSPLTVAANLGESRGAPVLDLFFDTSGHGSHVAGIAAGHGIYGISGYDGVAPGAAVIGLKIANDAQGGISTTDAMREAMGYAIRFAQSRHLALVMNMSFGVGNEREGAARIDAIVDSVLAEHPDVVFTISAGNDGPALSTLGFPGSADRVISVGALLPGRFVPVPFGAPPVPDVVAYFSSRGGELARPDLVTPGVAYSTVPRWDTGGEIEGGTSMASPHAAGLAALLLSAARAEKRSVTARQVRQALMVTASRLPGASFMDQGAGVPDVNRAWQWLSLGLRVPDVTVRTDAGMDAAFAVAAPDAPLPGRITFQLARNAGGRDSFRLRSSAPWLTAPAFVIVTDSAAVSLVVDTSAAGSAPVTGVVSGWTSDTVAGPAFRLITTLARAAGAATRRQDTVAAGEPARLFFTADSGRPMNVRVSSSTPGVQAFLHEPGGMPFRDGVDQEAGSGSNAAFFRVDGSDSRAGVWQVTSVGTAAQSVVTTDIEPSPARLALRRSGDSLVATLAAVSDSATPGKVLLGLLGAAQAWTEQNHGSAVVRREVAIPTWVHYLVVDVRMPPAQWERLTDFGVTLFDSGGTSLEQSPMNYAEGRLHHAFETPPGRVTLAFFPGFADSAAAQDWTADVRLRFYAENPAPLQSAPVSVQLAPGTVGRVAVPWTGPDWEMPTGAEPLGVVTLETAGGDWTLEAALPAPLSRAASR